MSLPEPERLSLWDAVFRIVDRCHVSMEAARAALEAAVREGSLTLYDAQFDKIDVRDGAIDCQQSSIRFVHYTIEGVCAFRRHVDHRFPVAIRPDRMPGGQAIPVPPAGMHIGSVSIRSSEVVDYTARAPLPSVERNVDLPPALGRGRTRKARNNCLAKLEEIYPGGVPDTQSLKEIKRSSGTAAPSDSTINRALGRKK